MKEFQGRARQGVNDETFGTSNGGGSLLGDQHRGEVGLKEAQCVRRLELKKGLSLAGKSLEQGRVGGNLRVRGQLPVWAEQQRQHSVLDGVLGVSNILFSL